MTLANVAPFAVEQVSLQISCVVSSSALFHREDSSERKSVQSGACLADCSMVLLDSVVLLQFL